MMRLRTRIKYIVKTVMETNMTPTIRDYRLQKAFVTLNRLDMGVNIPYDEIGYVEAKLMDMIQAAQNRVLEEQQQQAKNQMR